MIVDAAVAGLLCAWFAAIGVLSIVGLARSRRWLEAFSYGAHALMSGVMATMPWPQLEQLPPLLVIIIFGELAVWYVALAIFLPNARIGPGGAHHGSTLLTWYHAAMMAGMAWMGVERLVMTSEHGAMAGMTPWELPAWALAVTLAFAAMFAVAAVWFLVRLLRREPPSGRSPLPQPVELALSLAMAAGMCAALLLMA